MLGKHTLDPKEKTELKVHYATEGRPGPFEKVITLTTNIPGQEKIDIFKIKGEVREAPAAKISVAPRRITFEGNERSTGKTQALAITNEGSLPLVITGIHSKDGKTIYYDGAKEGNITIEPGIYYYRLQCKERRKIRVFPYPRVRLTVTERTLSRIFECDSR